MFWNLSRYKILISLFNSFATNACVIWYLRFVRYGGFAEIIVAPPAFSNLKQKKIFNGLKPNFNSTIKPIEAN